MRGMPTLNYLAIVEMEVMASRFLYAAAILGTCLRGYYLFIKAVRRRLSALNRGILQETSPANLLPAAVGLGERLRHIVENIIVSESSSPQKRHRPPSSLMCRSVDEEPFSFHTPATLKSPEGKWEKRPFPIMQAEARAARLALSVFSAVLPSTMDVWVDKTLLQGAANKGRSKSQAMTWDLRRIYGFLDSRGLQAFFAYVRSAENPADGISRGCVFYTSGIDEGEQRCRLAGGTQILPLSK
ncbi:putative target of rapamycin (TOR) kinase 1 [Trypanosoma cruzi]|uniref:Putative target of rapamycin (TOR) kinase 1 n=1 Tax=Trypanosoma cruzi TaxID=5693 RepID=A0A2V2W8K8_TRYCR|nr:putative target of rapamycin (TOR) kinase 1 [Trypanosoma cruzi]RNC40305.1 RNA-binding protein [Trypanosoma cruzi]